MSQSLAAQMHGQPQQPAFNGAGVSHAALLQQLRSQMGP